MCNMMICNTAIFRRLEINAWCLPSLRRPYATVCHCATDNNHASPPLAVKVFTAETSQVFTINAPTHHPLPCLCLPLRSCLIYKLPIPTYSGRKIAVLVKSTFTQNPKTWFRNVISQIARWLFSRRIADRRTLWRRLIMCVSSQVKDPTCGFTSVPIKTIVSQTDGLVLSGFDVDWKLIL